MPFFREVILSFPHGPGFVVSLAPIDINRDGRLDLVFAWSGNAYEDPNGNIIGTRDPISVLMNIDGESFVEAANTIFQGSVPTTLIPHRSFVGDFNGDGFQDLYIPDHGPEGGNWTGGPGTLLLSSTGGSVINGSAYLAGISTVTYALAIGDIDGDNDDDVLLTIAGGPTHLHVIVSDPSTGMTVDDSRLPFVTYDLFVPGNPYGFPSSISSALFDADGDGDLDLVLPTSHPGNLANPSLLLFNDSTGHFGYGANDSSKLPFILDNQNDTIVDVKAADLDGDGDLDFVATCLNANNYNEDPIVAVYSNNGTGRFEITAKLHSNSTGLEIIDISNDGYLDIVCGDNQVRSFFLNDGVGHFIPISDPTGQAGRLVRLGGADLNADGRTDLFAWSFDNNQVTIWFGQDQPAIQVGDGLANDLIGDGDNDTLSGLGGNDVLFGGAGADMLDGGSGNDTLIGGAGFDTLVGGTGNDTYQVGGQGDVIFENPGEGTDSVTASSNYYLYQNIENLTLAAGAGAIFGVGNDSANVLTGNEGENLLIAGAGDDEVHGGAARDAIFGQDGADNLFGDAGIDYIVAGIGNDTIDGGADADEIYGQEGDDTIYGGTSFDTDIIVGGDGSDTIYGNSGAGDFDYLYGNLGNDTFYVDTPADLVFEQGGEGIDTVYAGINGGGYYLYDNIDNLILTDNTPFGVGNGLDNSLTGNAIGNYLLGGLGNDTLNGMGGNDVLFGEGGNDTFVFTAGTGGDVIGDFTSGQDKIDISAFGFSFAQAQANFIQNGNVGAINLGNSDFIVLHNVTMSNLTAADFIFAAVAEPAPKSGPPVMETLGDWGGGARAALFADAIQFGSDELHWYRPLAETLI